MNSNDWLLLAFLCQRPCCLFLRHRHQRFLQKATPSLLKNALVTPCMASMRIHCTGFQPGLDKSFLLPLVSHDTASNCAPAFIQGLLITAIGSLWSTPRTIRSNIVTSSGGAAPPPRVSSRSRTGGSRWNARQVSGASCPPTARCRRCGSVLRVRSSYLGWQILFKSHRWDGLATRRHKCVLRPLAPPTSSPDNSSSPAPVSWHLQVVNSGPLLLQPGIDVYTPYCMVPDSAATLSRRRPSRQPGS